MPTLIHREQIGRRLKVTQAQEMFRRTVSRWEQQGDPNLPANAGVTGLRYDPEVFEYPEIISETRLNYLTEVLRQLAHTSRRVVAVVEEGFIPQIEQKWQRLPRGLRAIDSFLQMPEKDSASKRSPLDIQETWLEFIEKQVILDVLFEPYLYRNFVRLKAFPFDP